MQCARKSCSCEMSRDHQYEHGGILYCCEKCAKVCTDEKCVCKPEDCPQ